MGRPTHEVAQVIRQYREAFFEVHPQAAHHKRTLEALSQCRTAALGGHIDQCDQCGKQRISYNSCRNRHCPKCQGLSQQRWVEAREADLLPVPYYHLVFTLPDVLNGLCLSNPQKLYHLLFRASWETVETFAADHKYLGAQTGMVSVLHTWGQNLSLHPHVHAIVPGGGLTPQGKWRMAKGKGKFLFPVKAMSKVFRAKFVAGLRALRAAGELVYHAQATTLIEEAAWRELCHRLYRKPWVIYAKQPFAGPQQVIRYLGRYTHRIAISNHRLRSIENGKVSFNWKDYRQGGKKGLMTLSANEFLRRFCLHILPPGFTRLRHYGILSSRNKTQSLAQARESLGCEAPPKPQQKDWREKLQEVTELDLGQCPCCKTGRMRLLRGLAPTARSPPKIKLPKPVQP